MIKVNLRGFEVILEGEVWSCEEDEEIADMLNRWSKGRPFRYTPRVEKSIANYIVAEFKEYGAEITYDSEAGKPPAKSDPRMLDS